MTQEILNNLQHTLLQKFINVNIEKFDYAKCQELFLQVLSTSSYLLPDFYLTTDEVIYKPESNYIMVKFNSVVPLLNGQLLILFNINNFIITGVEVSIIY